MASIDQNQRSECCYKLVSGWINADTLYQTLTGISGCILFVNSALMYEQNCSQIIFILLCIMLLMYYWYLKRRNIFLNDTETNMVCRCLNCLHLGWIFGIEYPLFFLVISTVLICTYVHNCYEWIMLLNFLFQNGFYAMNSFFKKSPQRKWTWASPDGVTRNELDLEI